MEKLSITNLPKATPSTEMEQKDTDQSEEFLQSLHKQTIVGCLVMAKYRDFWFHEPILKGVVNFERYFKANDSDIILASLPKAGTTWLKALVFSIVNRKSYSVGESPLLFSNPHQLVPFLEFSYLAGKAPNIDSMPSPRIFATHVPYECLSDTIISDSSNCKIICICRNPLDVVISSVHFVLENGPLYLTQDQLKSVNFNGLFEAFYEGTYSYGPFWDHFLGYWNASLKNPHRVLFLMYEDLKGDIKASIKKIADFLGYPFSAKEEKDGLIEDIAKHCSLENLKNLECNKEENTPSHLQIKYNSFFRKGEVGDWVNHLPASMAERLEKLMKEKFGESGLTFKIQAKSDVGEHD